MTKYNYRSKRLQQAKKSFLGRSFLISIILNILLLYAFGSLISFDFSNPITKEELVLVSLIELPAPQKPVSIKPEIIEEKPIAQLEVSKKVEPISPEPPSIKEEVTETKVAERKEITQGTPKVEVKTPQIETTPTIAQTPPQTNQILGEEINIAEEYLKQSLASRKEVRGEVIEPGESTIKAELGIKGLERTEATHGTVINPGEIAQLPETKEKESPYGRRPLSVMIENSEGARPQAGLDKANIVYEMLAEGGITRFLAVYFENEAEVVGPVRSARPYFISKSLEHQAIYVHAGGSEEAYNFIVAEKIDDINEFINFQPFWRSRDRNPPHNLYTSTVELRKEAQKLGFLEMMEKEDYQFKTDRNEILRGKTVTSILIPYNRLYKVTYQYQPETMKYLRFINDEPHIDAKTKKQIQVDNVLIQFADTKVIDEEGRLSINLVGEGKGLVFFKGGSEEIIWKKVDLKSRTSFFDQAGNKIVFAPGTIWIQIVPSEIIIEY